MGEIVKNHRYARWKCKNCSVKYEKQGLFLGASSKWADDYCSEECWRASGAAPQPPPVPAAGGGGGAPSTPAPSPSSSGGPSLILGFFRLMWNLAVGSAFWIFDVPEDKKVPLFGSILGRLTTSQRRKALAALIVIDLILIMFF